MSDDSKSPSDKQNPSESKALSIKKFVQGDFELSTGHNGKDVWLTQKQIAELLGITVQAVSQQIGNYKGSPLAQDGVIKKFLITASDGGNRSGHSSG